MNNSPLLPDTNLTIYCLSGIVPETLDCNLGGFIGNWVESGHSYLFFREKVEDFIETLLQRDQSLRLVDCYTMTYAQWQGGTPEPFLVGRFLFNPPWIKAAAQPGQLSITLDAGVVFGNGTHPTTINCLQAIEIACSGRKVSHMLDLGTGTGILALAAARLGVSRVVAVDYTFLSTRTAARNVRLNNLQESIVVVNGKAEQCIAFASDLLVANVPFAVMKKIVASEGFLRQKWFVLSGLLRSEAREIGKILAQKPVLVLKRWNTGESWETILGITTRDE